MIEKYKGVDAEKFFKEYIPNKKRLARLKKEREDIPTEFSTDWKQERVTGGEPGDPTQQKLFKILALDEKIKELEEYFKACDLIFEELTSDEKKIVEALFIRNGGYRVRLDLMDELCCSESKLKGMIRATKNKVFLISRWI